MQQMPHQQFIVIRNYYYSQTLSCATVRKNPLGQGKLQVSIILFKGVNVVGTIIFYMFSYNVVLFQSSQ